MHALIIESNALLALAIEDDLRALGYTSFDWAASQSFAIKSALRRCPDLITSDDRLREGAGASTVKEISGDKCIPTVFIVEDHRALVEEMPGAVVIEKPYNQREFHEAVQNARLIANERNLTVWRVNSPAPRPAIRA